MLILWLCVYLGENSCVREVRLKTPLNHSLKCVLKLFSFMQPNKIHEQYDHIPAENRKHPQSTLRRHTVHTSQS